MLISVGFGHISERNRRQLVHNVAIGSFVEGADLQRVPKVTNALPQVPWTVYGFGEALQRIGEEQFEIKCA